MERNIPIIESYNKLSDNKLLEKFLSEPPIKKAMYHGVLASRLPKFKEILFDEAIDNTNRNTNFYGFIKISWLCVIAILEYADNDVIKHEISRTIKEYWEKEEYNDFKNYINNNPSFLSYFND